MTKKVIAAKPRQGGPLAAYEALIRRGPHRERDDHDDLRPHRRHIVKRRLKGKVRIGHGGTAQGTSALGVPGRKWGGPPLWGVDLGWWMGWDSVDGVD